MSHFPPGFEWDIPKAAANARKHDVTFFEASTIFATYHLIMYDPDHSQDEDRFVAVGKSSERRVLTVVHVERGPLTRIISARRATPNETAEYEQSFPKDP